MNQKEIISKQIAQIAVIQTELRRVATKRRKLEIRYPDGSKDAETLAKLKELKDAGWKWHDEDNETNRRLSAAIKNLWILGMQVPDSWAGLALHFSERWKMAYRRKDGFTTARWWRDRMDPALLRAAKCSLENTKQRLMAMQSILSDEFDVTPNAMKVLTFLYDRNQPANRNDIAGLIQLAPNTTKTVLKGLLSAGLCFKPSPRGGFGLSELGKRYVMLSRTRS